MRRAHALLLPLLACASLPAGAHASQTTKLHVAFTPERLGHGTSMKIELQITAPPGSLPSPLTELDLRYPNSLGMTDGGLGLETCSQARIELTGSKGCPSASRIGGGSALVEIPLGPKIIREDASISILRVPEEGKHLAMLFYAAGKSPVDAQISLPALILPASAPYERIHIGVPLVPSFPGAQVALVRLSITLGPRSLTYYERADGKVLSYHPQGVLLPRRCPRAGFAFSAYFTFLDGSHSRSSSTVPCPTPHSGRPRARSAPR
jgi:hypothetical protein